MPEKKTVTVSIVFTMAIILSSCSSTPLPQVTDFSQEQSIPALDRNRIEKITKRSQTVLDGADATRSSESLLAVMDSTALAMRQGEYHLYNATRSLPNPISISPLKLDPRVSTVQLTSEFPRLAMVVTNPPNDKSLPSLVTYVQSDPRSDYKIWSVSTLFPGTQVPSLKTLAVGTEQANSGEGILGSPKEIFSKYIKVLDDPNSADRNIFSIDPYSAVFGGFTKTLTDAVAAVGKVEISSELADSGKVYSLRTADGGALAVAVVSTAVKVSLTQPGARLTLGDQIGSFITATTGNADVKGSVTGQYLTSITMYIPPSDQNSSKQVQVIGASAVLSSVSRDDTPPTAQATP